MRIQVVPPPTPSTYTITDLTREEVQALAEVAYHIVGDYIGPRGFFYRLEEHLRSLGIYPTYGLDGPHGRIEF